MSFSYSGNPADSDLDGVRFLVGDTIEAEAFLSDEEIEFLVTTWVGKDSIYYTASMAAEAIAAKLAREVTVSSDSQTVSTSELQQKYLDLAARLRAQHQQLLPGTVDVGGILAGEQPDPTVSPPAFGTGMHDTVEAGNQDNGDQRRPLYYPDQWYGAY